MNYALHLLIYFGIYAIVSMSLNVITGYCGLITLSRAAFFAVGAYASALVAIKMEWEFLPAMGLGVVVAMIASLLISLPSKRLKGDLFVLLSLAVQVVVFSAIYNWSKAGEDFGTLSNLTNGPFGISGIPKPRVYGCELGSIQSVAVLTVILTAICAVLIWALTASPWGRLLKCMRDDELALRGLGKNTHLLTTQAFVVSAGMTAVAGAIYAAYAGYIDPSSASLNESILMLSMVMVGGLGNLAGPLVGAALLLAIPEALRLLYVPDVAAANIRLLTYGLLLILAMHLRPQGIAGNYRME